MRPWFKDLPGGRLGENLPHPLYLLASVVPDLTAKEVAVVRDGPDPTPDQIEVLLEGGDVLATISLTNTSRRGNLLVLCGERKSMMLDFRRGVALEMGQSGSPWSLPLVEAYRSVRAYVKLVGSLAMSFTQGIKRHGHFRQIDAFAKSIQDQGDNPVTPEDALVVVKLYEQILGRV